MLSTIRREIHVIFNFLCTVKTLIFFLGPTYNSVYMGSSDEYVTFENCLDFMKTIN